MRACAVILTVALENALTVQQVRDLLDAAPPGALVLLAVEEFVSPVLDSAPDRLVGQGLPTLDALILKGYKS
jgi:hypothetical protein